MKKKTLPLLMLFTLALLPLLLFPQDAVEAKKDLLKQLELINIALMLEQVNRPFKAAELEALRKGLPTVKEKNPKLYKDPRRTEKILLLYMILEEIGHAEKTGRGLKALVGKTRGALARDYVRRVFPVK